MKQAIVVSAILAGAAGTLFWVGIVRASIPVLTVEELLSGAHRGGTVQVDGGTVKSVRSRAPLVFTLEASPGGGPEILVRSRQLPPENLREGIPVSVRGVYDPDAKVLEAHRVSTRCPSRYRPESASGVPGTGGAPQGRGAP